MIGDEINDLKIQVAHSFPKWNDRLPEFVPQNVTRAQFGELRGQLFSVNKQSLSGFLGIIIYDLLDYHPNELADDSSYDNVINFLGSPYMIENQHKAADISQQQRQCICRFLVEAKKWPCSRWLQDEFSSAISYWCQS